MLSYEAKHSGKTDSAICYAKKAIKEDTTNNTPYNFLGNLLISSGKYDEGIKVLERNILSGNIPPAKIAYLFDNYESIKSRPEVIQFQKRIPSLVRGFYTSSYNPNLAATIYAMRGTDQAVRGNIDKLYPSDSIKQQNAMQIQSYLDTAVNLPGLLAYLDQYGFPSRSEMDDAVRNSLQLILHHLIAGYDGPQLDRLNRLVQQAIYEGKYSSYAYMQALDWRSINRNGNQIFGTYIGPAPNGVLTFYPPIIDVAAVDIRRAKWKQGPLKDVPLSDWRNPKLPADYKP